MHEKARPIYDGAETSRLHAEDSGIEKRSGLDATNLSHILAGSWLAFFFKTPNYQIRVPATCAYRGDAPTAEINGCM
jgi:hypothetical protein